MNHKRRWIAKGILKGKNKMKPEVSHYLTLNYYYRAMIIKTPFYWEKTDTQTHGTELRA